MKRSRSTTRTPRTAKRSQSGARSKSRVAKRRVSYAPTNSVVATPSVGLGQSARTVLKTVFYANATAAASGVWTGFLKPGSAFDPCGDIAAIQPALYDQWAATYGRYVVEKATVVIEPGYPNAGGNAVNSYVITAYPSINSSPLATFQAAASQPFAKDQLVQFGDGSKENKLIFKLDHAKVLGRKGAVTAEDNGALTGADPTTGEFMVLPIFAQFAQASASAITLKITLYQTVHFDRRINVVDA